jgi:hypothetical protein
MSTVRKLVPLTPESRSVAAKHACEILLATATALELLGRGDVSNADDAFKRAMIAAGDARDALRADLLPPVTPREQVDVALAEFRS